MSLRMMIVPLMVVFLGARAGAAQQDAWDVLTMLPAGTALRVADSDRRITEGTLQAIDRQRLVVSSSTTIVEMPRSAVRTVSRLAEGSQAGRKARIGLAIGAAVGTVIGATMVESNRGTWIPALAVGWGSIGALVGAIDGAGERNYVVVYRAP